MSALRSEAPACKVASDDVVTTSETALNGFDVAVE